MSSNKTTNYSLHSWAAGDDFRFHEVNENFTKLDTAVKSEAQAAAQDRAALAGQIAGKADKTALAALGRLVTGTYVGTGSGSQTFELGGQVLAVLIECSNGTRPPDNSSATQGGLILPGFQLRDGAAHIDGTSFTISCGGLNGWWYVNRKDEVYYYMAWVR